MRVWVLMLGCGGVVCAGLVYQSSGRGPHRDGQSVASAQPTQGSASGQSPRSFGERAGKRNDPPIEGGPGPVPGVLAPSDEFLAVALGTDYASPDEEHQAVRESLRASGAAQDRWRAIAIDYFDAIAATNPEAHIDVEGCFAAGCAISVRHDGALSHDAFVRALDAVERPPGAGLLALAPTVEGEARTSLVVLVSPRE